MLCSCTALEGAENVLIMHTAHPEQQWGLWGLSEGSGSYRRAIGLNLNLVENDIQLIVVVIILL